MLNSSRSQTWNQTSVHFWWFIFYIRVYPSLVTKATAETSCLNSVFPSSQDRCQCQSDHLPKVEYLMMSWRLIPLRGVISASSSPRWTRRPSCPKWVPIHFLFLESLDDGSTEMVLKSLPALVWLMVSVGRTSESTKGPSGRIRGPPFQTEPPL